MWVSDHALFPCDVAFRALASAIEFFARTHSGFRIVFALAVERRGDWRVVPADPKIFGSRGVVIDLGWRQFHGAWIAGQRVSWFVGHKFLFGVH